MYERLYQSLYRIRRLEERIAQVYKTDKIKSPVHLSIGQEAISVGLCEALSPQDVVFGTYRSHALYLAKGGDMGKMVAELYGKRTGCTKGKGGSMHLIAPEVGLMGTSAIVGTTIANAVGYAYALQLRGQNAIVVSVFGDGATEEGVFAESLAFAALKKLPILFVCENNFFAIHTPLLKRQGTSLVRDRARAHGLTTDRVEDGCVFTMYEKARAAVAHVRGGGGPFFLEALTYRWHEHVGPGLDFDLGYRSREEAEPWIQRDALKKTGEKLPAAVREEIERQSESEIETAFAFAESSPFPPLSDLHTDVWKGN